MASSENLGRSARNIVKRPIYAIFGILIAVASTASLIYYWATRDPALTAIVSTAVPVVVATYLAIVFTQAARTQRPK